LTQRARRSRQAIPTDAEVASVSHATVELLRRNLGDHPLFTRAGVERTVRLLPLGARCTQARARVGASVKDVARRLGVPQYRIRAIESGSLGYIRLDVLQAYVAFLGLERWYAKWRRANAALSAELERGHNESGRRGRTRR
jgi:transcriptional regulator with XRE-family HTH domain